MPRYFFFLDITDERENEQLSLGNKRKFEEKEKESEVFNIYDEGDEVIIKAVNLAVTC